LKNYREEIDGLRAIAVLPVIFFHAGFEFFQGGFVGVDIFFVISGYLITLLITNDLEKESFSIKHFYERRARRLLPALFLVLLVCLPVAWLWMLPADLKYFGQSLFSVSIFSSNFFFWLKTGYFDTTSELSPLLHTWSLAVEEQYYIIFPLLLMLIWKYKDATKMFLLLMLLVASLIFASYLSPLYPNFSFYMLPTRAWEILVGALIAFYCMKNDEKFLSEFLKQILSILGLALIIFSILIFDEQIPFPSLYTLMPVIGTGLIIIAAKNGTLVYQFLSFKPLVSLGLISYSAYLWHQPILAFARYKYVEDISSLILFFLCVAAILMAYVSWKFIEQPFRNARIISFKLFITISILLIFFISLTGLFLHFSDGAINRLPPPHLQKNFYKEINSQSFAVGINGKNCVSQVAELCIINEQNKNSTLLIGDSHSGDFSQDFKTHMIKKNYGAMQLSMGGCSFMPITFKKNRNCREAAELLKKIIRKGQVKRILLVTNQYKHLSFLAPHELRENINYFIEIIDEALNKNIQVIFFVPRPSFKHPVARSALSHNKNNHMVFHDKYRNIFDNELNALTENGLIIFDQEKIIKEKLCPLSNSCNMGIDNGYPFYSDKNHLSKYGARYVFNKAKLIL
jgi:peptidoglycan/LPS O-acetylase OafA/YrhL